MQQREFNVSGMTCSACSAAVEKAVGRVAGVQKAAVNLIMERLYVEMQDDTPVEAVVRAVEKAGYGIEAVQTEKTLRFGVKGMTCSACSAAVEKALRRLPGVSSASVNLVTNTAELVYDPGKLRPSEARAAVRKAGYEPATRADLATLRTVASTGSPLAPETFEWVYEAVAPGCGDDGLHLASISGGTDLCACFVCGDPTSPVHAGEIQRPALGMAVEVVGDDGKPVGPDVRGELVCTGPFPSMPLGFWGDGPLGTAGPKYLAAYFDRFPEVWAQGDFATWTRHGGIVIHGRSDTTLNPGGVSIGTAEIYRQVEQVPEVLESLVFGREVDGDVQIVLLVRLAEGRSLDDELVAEIRRRIREGCTPRHVPALVLAVEDLPRTRSGKLVELAVADRVNGREVRNTSALANPEALDAIARLPELRR